MISSSQQITVVIMKWWCCDYNNTIFSCPVNNFLFFFVIFMGVSCVWLFPSAATTYQACQVSDETGKMQPLNQPFSKGEIKANRLSQLNHKSTVTHRKELVAQ